MHKKVGLSENNAKNWKKWDNFLGSNGLISAPTFSKFSQHTGMILYNRIFAFFCWALDLLRTYVMGDGMAFIFHKSHLKMQFMGEINYKHCKTQPYKKWKSSDKQCHNIDNIWLKVVLNKSEEWNWEDTNLKYWHKTNTSQGIQEIRLYSKPPQRWPNRGRRVKRL